MGFHVTILKRRIMMDIVNENSLILETYKDFINAVEALGVLSLYGKFVEGFPKLSNMTLESAWHTGDQDTDPWQWKTRAVVDHKLAFGCLLGGYKGFISRDMYSLFYTACRPENSLEERFENGTVSRAAMGVYELFRKGSVLSTDQIRKEMGVSKKDGVSQVDRAIVLLQKEFYIAVCGSKCKTGLDGREYGWPSNTYCLVEDWAEDWLAKECMLTREEALEHIMEHCEAWGKEFDRKKLRKILGKK